jgi:uncharacterized damage-inducible protein DinB
MGREVAMKNELRLFARYNSLALKRVYDILEKVPSDLLCKDSGSYFGSIIGILNHLLRSDLIWLGRLHTAFPDMQALEKADLSQPASFSFKDILYSELAPLRRRHEGTARIFSSLIEDTDEDLLTGDFAYVNSKGEKGSAPVGLILLHLFNHQTHHRGAVSQILDREGIENDFSSFLSAVK